MFLASLVYLGNRKRLKVNPVIPVKPIISSPEPFHKTPSNINVCGFHQKTEEPCEKIFLEYRDEIKEAK